MLVCRACKTRFEKGTRACPSCGRRATASSADSGSSDISPLPPSAGPTEIDLELDESQVLEEQAPAAAPASKRKKTRSARTPAPRVEIATGLDQVKSLLSERPGLLEKGLGIYADEEGEPAGVDFETPVGSIDLLCQDRKGGFLAVHLPAPNEVAESVSALLCRMGWVRKHLAEDGAAVRGVVVLEQLPEELAYIAAGAAGAIEFKGFELGLSFHDLGD
jgi:hypothetical protein